MADTSGRLVSFLVEGDDFVSCEVCMEPFDPLRRPPKLLPCGHNFCESCLFTMCCHQQYYFLDHISCPTCRASFDTAVAKSAPTNYDLCKVLESVQRGIEMANVTVIQVTSQPQKEMSAPLKQLAQKSYALRHKKCSDCRRKLPSKTLTKTSRFCELCNTLDTMKFTCLECCINRHNGHILLTIRELESNQLKAVNELRDTRRKIIEASESFDSRLAQIGLQGHAACLVSQKKTLVEEILRCNEETMQRVEAARLVSGTGLRNLRSEQVHNLSQLANLNSMLEKTVVVEKKFKEKPLDESDSAKRQSRLTLRSDDSLARESLSNLLVVLPIDGRTRTLSTLVAGISPRDSVDDRKLIYFNCAKIITEILSSFRMEDITLMADALLNCFYQLNILSKKKNEKGKINRQAIWKLIQYSYSVVMELVAKVYPTFHPERVNILDDLAFLCHLFSDVCDQATVARLIIEAARARSAEGHLSPDDQKRTEERLQLIDEHLLELRRIQRLNDLKSKTTTRASGFDKGRFSRCVVSADVPPTGFINCDHFMQSSRLLLLFLPLVVADPPFLFPHGYFDSNKLKPFDAIYLNLMAASNLEYGGTTLEELDGLDASRKIITRPNGLARTREEDDTALDREPVTDGKEGDEIQAKRDPSKKFLRRLRDDMGMNPFEEIATRAPPRAVIQFQQLRRQLKKSRKMTKNRSHRKRAKKLNRQRKTTETTTIPPTLIPTVSPKLRRLPNNPYGSLDISNPNIMPLPIPPEFV